jgi:hypothetical protein
MKIAIIMGILDWISIIAFAACIMAGKADDLTEGEGQ